MTDTFDPAMRSWIMSRVKSVGTSPEVRVRTALRTAGYSSIESGKLVPGHPDLTFRKLRLAVFVNGCFWHWHGCKRSRMPKSHRTYWKTKIDRNVRRDRKARRMLRLSGWRYVTIWECRMESGIARLLSKLRK